MCVFFGGTSISWLGISLGLMKMWENIENMPRLVSAQFHQWFGFSFMWRWVKPGGSYWPLHGVLRCAHPQITPKSGFSFFLGCTKGTTKKGELWGCSRSGSPLWALLSDLGKAMFHTCNGDDTFPSLNFGSRSSRTPNYGWLNDWCVP